MTATLGPALTSTPSLHRAGPLPRGPWPLTVFFVGFPVFWALGLGVFALPLVSVPMLWQLRRRGPLHAPRGFGIWALFLVWSVAGIIVLGVDPPGTLPGSAAGRLFGFGLREISYFSITVVLLYIVNLSARELPTQRIFRLLGWLFIWTVLGGVAGLVLPDLSFSTPFEMVLPHSISSNLYVQHLVHPATAQVQEFSAGATPRPAAPFGYTNTWGFHVTLLAPFFVLSWIRPARGLSRVAAVAVLLVGAVVLVYSLNRAAWIAAILMAVFIAVRLALRGHVVPVLSMAVVGAVAAGVFLASPLHGVVDQRIDDGKSNDIRSFTSQRALELAERSPVIGYGSTRSTYGSSSSIAVGTSAECPQCGNRSIGINGYFFLLLMSTGYVGTALFFGFWISQLWRSRHDRSPYVLVAGLTIVTAIFYAFFYDVSAWLVVPAVALAVLGRAGAPRPEPWGPA